MALEVIYILSIISGIIFIGFLAELLFRKTKIPDVLFLILIGVLLGSVFSVGEDSFGIGSQLFVTFTLLFILFQGAINIDFKTLYQSFKGTMKLTFISFFLAVLIVSLISFYLMGYSLLVSLLLGMILGGTCSAVVIPFVKNLNLDKRYGSVLILESAISDVLCIVGAITIVAILKTGSVETAAVIKSMITSFLLASSIGIIVAVIWISLLYRFRMLGEYHMVTIALVIALYSFVESPFVAASGAIAALAFGLMLGNSRLVIRIYSYFSKENDLNNGKNEVVVKSILSDKASHFYSEIAFFVKVFFFVYLGILIDFSDPMVFVYGGILALGIFIVRPLAVSISFFREQMDARNKNALRVLVPRGLAAAVLARLVLIEAIPGTENLVNLVFSVILISVIFTSILVFITQRKGQLKNIKRDSINKSKSHTMIQEPSKRKLALISKQVSSRKQFSD